MPENLTPWILFTLFIIAMLAVDLGLFHRKTHAVSVKEALVWSAVWIGLALAFNVIIYYWKGEEAAFQFFTGYLIEKSLSVDNIFVFLQVFAYFGLPAMYQHRVLFYGVLGAIVMRLIFIIAGVALIAKFHWIIYVFGAFLVLTGAKMAVGGNKPVHPEKNLLLKLLSRFIPVSKDFADGKFLTKRNGVLMATPLLAILLVIETTDVIFAVDSVPAILAITTDPFIVYSSNIFAIMGLRSLYFAFSGIVGHFRFIHYGLAAILTFVGIKILISDIYKVPTVAALAAIAAFLTLSMLASARWPKKTADKDAL
ncbi:MAG: TerC family protein [Deltaproteobacteria bacterium]|nr:TerC family protein [Deltaproteobacteria bacterium]